MNWKRFFKVYNEWMAFPIALVLFFVAPRLYQIVDPTAGAFDAGIFHTSIYAIANLFLFSGVAWLIMKIKFPELKDYLDDSAEIQLVHGNPDKQKAAIMAFAIYFGYMILLYLISNTL